MKTVLLIRGDSTDEGTFGELFVDEAPFCVTIELPWRDNERMISCIPSGIYSVYTDLSPSRQERTYRLKNVQNRDGILIHSANLAGDEEKGYVKQVLGCIAPGRAVATFQGGRKPCGAKTQRGVTHSGSTTRLLTQSLGEEFNLEIRWARGKTP